MHFLVSLIKQNPFKIFLKLSLHTGFLTSQENLENLEKELLLFPKEEHFKKLSVPYATHFPVAYGTHFFNAHIFFRKCHQWQSSFSKHKGKCTLSISTIIFYIKYLLSAWWPIEVGKI